MGKEREHLHLEGNRFQSDVAPNRSRADIRDVKNNRLLVLLNHEDLEELHELTGQLLRIIRE